MELANHIIDGLIVYTEAMSFYVLLACLILHIDKWLDRYETKQLQPVPELKALPPGDDIEHQVVPFVRARSYFTTWTCKQLRAYLKDLGYGKLNRLRKHQLIELAEVA